MKKLLQISFVIVAILTLMLIAAACGKTVVNIGVDFIVDGATYAQVSTTGQETISLPKDPTKEGYVFRGWYWDKDVWSQEFTVNSLMNQPLTESIKVYAYFITQAEADSNKTVIFNTMGAGTIDSVEIKNGNLLSEPAALTKEGYLFVGWFREADFTTKWNFKTDLVQESMTLYAKWVEDIPENRLYTVAFNSNGGTAVSSITDIPYNTLIQKPANPTNGDYALVGWYKDNTFAEEWNFDFDRVTENRTLYARYQEADVTTCALVSATGFTINDKNLSIKVANGAETFSFLERITVSPFASWTVVNDLQGKDAVPSGNVEIAVGDNTKYILVTSYDGLHKSFYTVTIHRRLMYAVSLIHGNDTEDDLLVPYEEDSLIAFPELTRTGYILTAWLDGVEEAWDAEADTVQGDIVLTAEWTANTYAVSFDSAEGSEVEAAEATYDAAFSFVVPERTGYTFLGWTYEEELLTDGTGASLSDWTIAEDVTLVALWEEEITYTIAYENLKGATNPNVAAYTVTQAVTFSDLSKDGYAFNGWTDENGDAVEGLAVGSVDNRTITANWSLIEYTATFLVDGAEVDTLAFNVETVSLVEPAIPAKVGYMSAWASYSFPARNIEINAIYTPITYTITYVGVAGNYDIDTPVNDNPSTYTIESAKITFANASKSGYTFDGWTDENGDAITEIPAEGTGNRTITAHWTAVSYDIIYTGLTGDYDVDVPVNENATSYTIESDVIALSVASKTGYTFDGWRDETGAPITAIPANTIGNRMITAHWSAVSYNITYIGLSGDYDVDAPVNESATSYTIESAVITLCAASKTGYTFDGWTDEAGGSITAIPANTIGNRTITAHWSPIDYNLTFVWNDEIGNYKDGENNPTIYTVEETVLFKVLESHAVGYTSIGWFTSEVGGEYVEGILSPTIGDKIFYAHWGLENFTISYFGVSEATNNNLLNYTIETETFNLNDPTKIGYDFNGWFIDQNYEITATTTITKGSHTDLVFYAKWTATIYTIEYNLNGGDYTSGSNPLVYTIEDTFSLLSPTRSGYVFDCWYNSSNDKINKINLGTTGNLTLTASWLRISTISFNSNGGSAVSSIVKPEGTTISAPSAPSKSGYGFIGWYDKSLTYQYSFSVMPHDDLTLYAKWEQIYYREGNYIYFGSYPQSQVTNSTIKNALSSAAGALPTASNKRNWSSYKYYKNSSNTTDYMWYIDLTYKGEKYRGVYFTEYRPRSMYYNGAYYSNQDDHGYVTSTVYWFKYDPIKWKVLSESNGTAFILCEMIIDSQDYYVSAENSSTFSHNGGTGYANNYALSNIRKWLNNTFYNTAFSTIEKKLILLTTVDNSATSTNTYDNPNVSNNYVCSSTRDYVFLLSRQEVTNTNYDINRKRDVSEYAKSQGVWTEGWWLRSPSESYFGSAYRIYLSSYVNATYVSDASNGVVPALKIKL